MKRRELLKSMAALGAAIRTPQAVFAQQAPAAAEQAEETALPLSLGDQVAEAEAHFFTAGERAAFRRLADVLVPRTRTPGAIDAGAAEFLEFYVGCSGAERQGIYRRGIERLESEAQRQFHKPFVELGVAEVDRLLAPLREPWTAAPKPDPLGDFLRAAKEDVVRATMNSREWASAREGRRRGAPGGSGGTYWYPVE